jgi:hypothetical protein
MKRWLIFILAGWSVSSFAADMCVSPSGAGDGSDWNNPLGWASFVPLRGNTYYLASGTYGSKTLNTAVSGASLIHIKKAVDQAHGPSAGWKSQYGAGAAQFEAASLSILTSYWDIDGVTGGGPDAWQTNHGFAFTSPAGAQIHYIGIESGVSNTFFRHISFAQTGDTTAFPALTSAFYNPGDLSTSTIEYCHFDNLSGLPFFLRNGTGNIIQYNYSGDICGASVYDIDIHCEMLVLHDMDDVHFRWNYVAECPSSGGFVKNNVQTSSDIRIYGNVFEDGFPIQCNTGNCTGWRIVNNTFHHLTGGPFGGDGTFSGLLFYNNIVHDGTIGVLRDTHGYNWFSSVSGRCQSGANNTENITVRPGNCDLLNETRDPFVNASGHSPENFKLTAPLGGWPGTDVCSMALCGPENQYQFDIFGKTRGADGVWDRGAYEYEAEAPASLARPRRLKAK